VSHLPAGPIHHIRLAVTDVDRSKAFYTEVLGFDVAVDAPPPPDDEHHDAIADSLQGGVILMHQGMFFGLDHLSFSVPARADLDAALRLLDERGVEHGSIRELAPLGLCFLAFFDPDGIALELTAPI